jgi:hypothetical protein
MDTQWVEPMLLLESCAEQICKCCVSPSPSPATVPAAPVRCRTRGAPRKIAYRQSIIHNSGLSTRVTSVRDDFQSQFKPKAGSDIRNSQRRHLAAKL